jgi:hypothetical protein
LFDGKGMKSNCKVHLPEGALARNLTLTLQHGRFVILQEHIANLLEQECGQGLLLSLSSPEHGALVLKDAQKKFDFNVDVAPRIVNCLGDRKPRPITLSLQKESAHRLSRVLTLRTWATLEQDAPVAPATPVNYVEPAESPSFMQQLAAAAPLRLVA